MGLNCNWATLQLNLDIGSCASEQNRIVEGLLFFTESRGYCWGVSYVRDPHWCSWGQITQPRGFWDNVQGPFVIPRDSFVNASHTRENNENMPSHLPYKRGRVGRWRRSLALHSFAIFHSFHSQLSYVCSRTNNLFTFFEYLVCKYVCPRALFSYSCQFWETS